MTRILLPTACLMSFAYFAAWSGNLVAEDDPVQYRVYIGTYTRGESEGIYTAELNVKEGSLSEAKLAASAENPSFLAVHPNGRYLYAVNETSDFRGQPSGALSAFTIDHSTGRLTLLNQVPSGGGAPCHLVVDATGKSLLTANYSGGSVSVTAIRDDGSLGRQTSFHQHKGSSVNPRRQQAPHAHSINLDAANKFAFVADLGLDEVVIYRFHATPQTLSRVGAAKVEPGAGPRHFSMHPSGRTAYVINELDSTITVFQYEASSGELAPTQTISTLPADFQGTSHTAEVVVHPSGKFVYGSNRGHDSLAVFEVSASDGQLRLVQIEPTGGKTPRNFAIDPSGALLLAENQGSNTIVLFRIDPDTGRLTKTGRHLDVPSPVCVRFVAPQ